MKKCIVLKGDIIWTESPDGFRYQENGYLAVEDGLVHGVYASAPEGEYELLDFTGSIIAPGLSDLHVHAPQHQFAGLFMDEELLEWLNAHTFPYEARFSDTGYAEKAYRSFVSELGSGATTRAAVFATIHRRSSLILMRQMESAGLRGYVGKVSMDRNSPDILIEGTDEAIAEEEAFLEEASRFSKVLPIITPRFIPSCSDSLLQWLGDKAIKDNLPVQSHLDENLSEVEWVKELCPWSRSYADAYGRFGLLGDMPTIMAHVVWPTEEEMDLLFKRNVYVAHSPSSNTNLRSGIAPVRRFLDKGIRVGLATDAAGGSSLSMLRMVTDAVQVSKLRSRYVDDSDKPLRFSEAFYLASKGGGSFFGKVGSFETGYDADIIVLDDGAFPSVLRSELSVPERLEMHAYRHSEAPVAAKFVRGERII